MEITNRRLSLTFLVLCQFSWLISTSLHAECQPTSIRIEYTTHASRQSQQRKNPPFLDQPTHPPSTEVQDAVEQLKAAGCIDQYLESLIQTNGDALITRYEAALWID